MNRSKVLIAAALLIGLAGCGQRESLKPAKGHELPPKPATAATTPTVGALLAPPIETRPARSDDVLQKSEERPDDRFNLPIPG